MVHWAYRKTKESLIYQYDAETVENAERNETSSIVAFPLYVLNQELELSGERDAHYINLYSAMREIPKRRRFLEWTTLPYKI